MTTRDEFVLAVWCRVVRAAKAVARRLKVDDQGQDDAGQIAVVAVMETWDRIAVKDHPESYAAGVGAMAVRVAVRRGDIRGEHSADGPRRGRRGKEALPGTLPDKAGGSDPADVAEVRDLAAAALSSMDPKEAAAVGLVIMRGHTLVEAGLNLGVHNVRVSERVRHGLASASIAMSLRGGLGRN